VISKDLKNRYNRLIGVISDTHGLIRPEVYEALKKSELIIAVIFGHSHRPFIGMEKGVLFLNPGSAGPRRFHLPISIAFIYSTDHGLDPELIKLG
jgi:predicted phosphodiesterase